MTSPADVLRGLLQAAGWSQTDLAWMLGVAPGTICLLCNGRRRITERCALRFEAAFRERPDLNAPTALDWMLMDAQWRRRTKRPKTRHDYYLESKEKKHGMQREKGQGRKGEVTC